MTLPLMTLGPGGDYAVRYEPVGQKLSRKVGQPQGQSDNPDTDSGSSMAFYSRPNPQHDENAHQQSDDATDRSPLHREDRFEPTADASDSLAGDDRARRWVKAGSLAAAASAVDAWIDRQLSDFVDSHAAVALMHDITTSAKARRRFGPQQADASQKTPPASTPSTLGSNKKWAASSILQAPPRSWPTSTESSKARGRSGQRGSRRGTASRHPHPSPFPRPTTSHRSSPTRTTPSSDASHSTKPSSPSALPRPDRPTTMKKTSTLFRD